MKIRASPRYGGTSFYVFAMFCIFSITVYSFTSINLRRSNKLQKPKGLSVGNFHRHQGRRSEISLSASSTTNGSNGSKDTSYLQWSHQKDLWKMQTAVTTFRRGDQTVELHSQLHIGDWQYFEHWNSDDKFNKKFDCVLYELLVDEDLLKYEQGNWRLKDKIMASPSDKIFGQNLGLQCQVSVIDYTKPTWCHADLSRQEFTNMAQMDNNNNNNNKSGSGGYNVFKNDQPLWKLASPESSSTAAEAVAALMVGPPTLNYSTQIPRKRRLFTNLFLPGGSLAFALRGILWMTIPAPELSIILLDWSSLLQGGSNPSALSQLALPILTSLVKFDFPQMRKFLFGQVLISSKKSASERENSSSSWSLLVIKRNDHALDILRRKLEEKDTNSVALLYGSSHCPDLHNKIVSMGFKPTKTIWRTAWSAQEGTGNDHKPQEQQGVQTPMVPALGAFLIFYLLVGGFDWVGMVDSVSSLLLDDANYLEAIFEVIFYLFRHVLLYLTMSKSLVDWTES